jgi:hypothetical protein
VPRTKSPNSAERARFSTGAAGGHPHYSGHKMRRMAVAGFGEMRARVNEMMRTEREDRTKPTPRLVLRPHDITAGLGLDAADAQKVQRLVDGNPAGFHPKAQTQRVMHSRGAILTSLRAMKHIESSTRAEIMRRVSALHQRQGTGLDRTPTIRLAKAGPRLLFKAAQLGFDFAPAPKQDTKNPRRKPSRGYSQGMTTTSDKPPAGYSPAPDSKLGAWRKRTGKGKRDWDYWYPPKVRAQMKAKKAKAKAKKKAKKPAPFVPTPPAASGPPVPPPDMVLPDPATPREELAKLSSAVLARLVFYRQHADAAELLDQRKGDESDVVRWEAETALDRVRDAARVEFTVPLVKLAELADKMEAMRKRAKRLKLDMNIGFEELERFEQYTGREILDPETGDRIKEMRTVAKVRIFGEAPHYKGWSLMGRLDFNAAPGATVRAMVPGKDLPAEYRGVHRETVCEHCQAKRKRNDLFVVEHEDGKTAVVGRQCIGDYLGGMTPRKAALAAELLAEVATFDRGLDEDGDFGSYKPSEYIGAQEYLTFAAHIVRTKGFAPARFGAESTKALVNELVMPPSAAAPPHVWQAWKDAREKVTDRDRAMGIKALAWAKELDPGSSDYLANLKAVAQSETISAKTMGLAASLISAYEKAMGREAKRTEFKKRDESNPPQYVGRIKERMQLKGMRVEMKRTTEGYYGMTTIVKFRDADNNVFTWFASGEKDDIEVGDVYTMKATIKKHEEFRGTKQNVITRAALQERTADTRDMDEVAEDTSEPAKPTSKLYYAAHGGGNPDVATVRAWDARLREITPDTPEVQAAIAQLATIDEVQAAADREGVGNAALEALRTLKRARREAAIAAEPKVLTGMKLPDTNFLTDAETLTQEILLWGLVRASNDPGYLGEKYGEARRAALATGLDPDRLDDMIVFEGPAILGAQAAATRVLPGLKDAGILPVDGTERTERTGAKQSHRGSRLQVIAMVTRMEALRAHLARRGDNATSAQTGAVIFTALQALMGPGADGQPGPSARQLLATFGGAEAPQFIRNSLQGALKAQEQREQRAKPKPLTDIGTIDRRMDGIRRDAIKRLEVGRPTSDWKTAATPEELERYDALMTRLSELTAPAPGSSARSDAYRREMAIENMKARDKKEAARKKEAAAELAARNAAAEAYPAGTPVSLPGGAEGEVSWWQSSRGRDGSPEVYAWVSTKDGDVRVPAADVERYAKAPASNFATMPEASEPYRVKLTDQAAENESPADAIAQKVSGSLRDHLSALDGTRASAAWVRELDDLVHSLADGWESGSDGLGGVVESRSDSPKADHLLDAADALRQSARGAGPRRQLDQARLTALRQLLEG